MELPPLNALRAFEAAARNMSFSVAGDELSVTHVAISHHIKHLEEWLGCRLFHRTGRGVQLTKEGTALSERTTSNLRGLDDICRRIKTRAQRPALKVRCLPSIASRWLIPKLPNFSEMYPSIDIQVFYATAESEALSSDWEILVSAKPATSESTVCRKLFSRRSRPVCSPAFLKNNPSAAEPAGLRNLELLHDESQSDWKNWFAVAGVELTSDPQGPIFQDFNLLSTAVIAGHGVALCPVDVFQEELSRGDLCVLSELQVNENDGYYITHRKDAETSVAKFVDWFLDATQP